FTVPPTTESSPLSLHDALPISRACHSCRQTRRRPWPVLALAQSTARPERLSQAVSTCRWCKMILPRALSMPIDHAPLLLIQQGTELVFNQMLRQHPNLFDRLGSHAEKSFRFTPADLNLSFLIVPARRSITVSRKSANMRADASASGPLLTLLALLEGRIDGDAMF